MPAMVPPCTAFMCRSRLIEGKAWPTFVRLMNAIAYMIVATGMIRNQRCCFCARRLCVGWLGMFIAILGILVHGPRATQAGNFSAGGESARECFPKYSGI